MFKLSERAGASLVIGIILLVVAACSIVYLVIRANEEMPDFMSTSPISDFVVPGESTTATVAVQPFSAQNRTVTLSANGAPSGVNINFNPSSGEPPFDSTMAVTTSLATSLGPYKLTITGTDADGIEHSTTYTLKVRLSEVEMENLARQRVREYWENLGENVEYWENRGHQIQLVELNEPLVDELVVKHKIYKSHQSWISPCNVCIVAVGCYDGHTFVLPNEFNIMIQREEISANETTALNLSKVYLMLWSQDYPRYGQLLFLESATDIPWSENAEGENPSKYENIVEPPYVSFDGGKCQVMFYTWSEYGGELYEWLFEVDSDGRVFVHSEQIAIEVGDFRYPPI